MAAPGRVFAINLLADSKPAEKAFKKVGQSAGRLKTPVGIATAAITASFVAVVAAVGKVGKELLELGEQFNDAYRIIQVGTGAVEGDLASLQQSFRDVVAAVPSSFNDTATAIAEVNTRLGLTGDDLDRVSEQFLNLSRLTGGDVTADIRGATRMFNRFGVEADDTSDMLDFLFRVSQATGIGIEKLGKNTTDYGAQLQNMGLSLEEAVVFMGLLEREGASVTRIMPSLNTAAMKLKAEGFDNVNEGLTTFIDELRTLDDDAAEARAMEILGSQYKNFLDVVRDNNVDYGELVGRLQDSQVTINDTARETDGVREAWEEFKNYLKLQFEEPATAVFEGLKGVIEELRPAVDRVKEAFEEDGLKGALAQVAEEWDRIYTDKIEPLWEGFLKFLNDVIKPLAIELGEEIGAAIADGIATAITNALTAPGRAISAGTMALIEDLFNIGPPDRGPRPGETLEERIQREREAAGLPPSGTDYSPPPRPDRDRTPTPPGGGGGPSGDPSFVRGGAAQTAAIRAVPLSAFDNFTVPGLADGGLVMKPTLAMIGEAGPEVAIPLDRLGGMGGQTTINVTVTSADPQAVVEALRRYTRQNGALSQVVTV